MGGAGGMGQQAQPNIQGVNEPLYPNGDYFDQKPVKGGQNNDNMFLPRNNGMTNGSRNNE